MMVLGVRFEMRHQLIDTLAQDRDLHFWRTGIRFVDTERCDRLAFNCARQCHAGIDTPRLFLTVLIQLQQYHSSGAVRKASGIRKLRAGSGESPRLPVGWNWR